MKEVNKHYCKLIPYGNEEKRCIKCGYVTWSSNKSDTEIIEDMINAGYEVPNCDKKDNILNYVKCNSVVPFKVHELDKLIQSSVDTFKKLKITEEEKEYEIYLELKKKYEDKNSKNNETPWLDICANSGGFLFNETLLEKATIKQPEYVIGVDTHDKNSFTYCFGKKIDGVFEIILSKIMRDEKEFKQEVENLSKYFNTDVFRIGD